MANTSDSDPNINRPFAPSNVILPSCSQNSRKKRTKISNNENSSSSSTPKRVRKPDPNAPNITQPCCECGREFWSLKALHGHMRCHPERQWRGINPPPNHQRTVTTAPRVPVTSEEDNAIASSLLMLANGSTSGSSEGVGRSFECEGCKKVFRSHQALHNHVKGCSVITNLTEDSPPPPPHQEIVEEDHKSKSVKLVSGINHRCNICFRVFSSGQALGGHMRCHWQRDQGEKNQDSTVIDLNVPAVIDLNVPASTNLPGCSSDTLSNCSLDLRLGL